MSEIIDSNDWPDPEEVAEQFIDDQWHGDDAGNVIVDVILDERVEARAAQSIFERMADDIDSVMDGPQTAPGQLPMVEDLWAMKVCAGEAAEWYEAYAKQLNRELSRVKRVR